MSNEIEYKCMKKGNETSGKEGLDAMEAKTYHP